MKQESKDKSDHRIAIIDIGSNTFHLLIVGISSESTGYEVLYRERRFVYLAKEGIAFLSPETIDRGIYNLGVLLEKCREYDVTTIKAIGTAALRSAGNAEEFVSKVFSKFQLRIEVISGKREAELIHKGTAYSGIEMIRPCAIVDIGGGSVEFIIVREDRIQFYESYNIGVSQLRHQFKYEDPLSQGRISMIYSHLDDLLSEFVSQAISLQVETVIGASGPFEIIESMCNVDVEKYQSTSREDVIRLIEKVIYLPLYERESLPLMPVRRADLSVESLLLIRYLFLRIASLTGIIISPYALKEGVISELI